MTAEELERRAASGLGLPENLTAPEELLFLGLRHIYHDWRSGLLTKTEAKAEKDKVLAQYKTNATVLDDTKRLCKIFVSVTNDTEPLRRSYHLAKQKGASPEELLGIACQIIRAATGDRTF